MGCESPEFKMSSPQYSILQCLSLRKIVTEAGYLACSELHLSIALRRVVAVLVVVEMVLPISIWVDR